MMVPAAVPAGLLSVMKEILHTEHPPAKTLMVFDGECGFCRYWITHWQWMTGDRVDYAPFQEVAATFPDIPEETFARAVVLIEPEGEVVTGAQAVFQAYAHLPRRGWLLWLYRHIPGVALVAELVYRWVAAHRTGLGVLTRWLWGFKPQPSTYFLTRWIFLRFLGLVTLVAFGSLWIQISGLVGRQGISPAAGYLFIVQAQTGIERFWNYPTLAWLSADDWFLNFLCAVGAFSSLLLILRIAPALMLLVIWICYLSLTVAGQIFLNYQWDVLLIETVFLAIFLAPWQLRPRLADEPPPPRAIIWLFRLLLFRLVFSSGVVKLTSGDTSWRSLTALKYHFETQPLPTWIGWWFYQLPPMALKTLTLLVLVTELLVPFLIFTPRRPRIIAFIFLVLLQVLIMVTGNYTFFCWLSIALCFLLLDDPALRRLWPRRWQRAPEPGVTCFRLSPFQLSVVRLVALLILLISSLHMVLLFRGFTALPKPLKQVVYLAQPFRIVNSYGLFAWMTKDRPEIIIEGTNDGRTWKAYEFKWKPGDVNLRPRFVAPHQPRLDWQMWFAALDSYQQNPWVIQFMVQLLRGSPDVLALLRTNPFPAAPPVAIRAVVYDYRFTHWKSRLSNGQWWQRRQLGFYAPALMLENQNPFQEARRAISRQPSPAAPAPGVRVVDPEDLYLAGHPTSEKRS